MLHAGALKLDDLRRAGRNWPLLALGAAAIILGIFLTSIRWQILLRIQGISLRLRDLFALMMTGSFFTMAAPGGLGGDAIKAWYVARGREKKAEAATTVFLDRLFGLASLLFVAAVVIALDFRRLWNLSVAGISPLGQPIGRVLVLVIAAAALALAAFAVLVTSKRIRRSPLPGLVARFIPFRRTAEKVYDALHLCGGRPGAMLAAFAVSIAAQLPLYFVYYLYAIAIGVPIDLLSCAVVVPPAIIIRVLPIMPAGAGQGMAAMAILFPLVGVQSGGTIGAIGDAVFVIVYLIGGLFFLFGRAKYAEARTDNSPRANATE